MLTIFVFSLSFGQLADDTLGFDPAELSSSAFTSEEIAALTTPRVTGYDPLEARVLTAFEGDMAGLSGQPRALDIDGNVAYVLCTDRLISVDITHLDYMIVLDYELIDYQATDIEVRGNFAYITRTSGYYNSDLLLVDIHDPENLGAEVSIYNSTSYQFRALDLEGNVAYIACRYEVISLNIQDPSSVPVPLLDVCSGCYSSKDIEIDGNYAYVSGSRIDVFDLSDPTDMEHVRTVDSGTVWSLVIDGDYLFAACYSSGLIIYDITDPEDIVPIDTCEVHAGCCPCGVVVMGDWCYLTSIVPSAPSMGIIDAIDIEYPTSPTVVDEGATPPSPLFKSAKHGETWVLSVSGDATYKYLTSMKVGYVEPNLLTKYIEYHSIVYPEKSHEIPPSQVKVRGNWAAIVDSTGMHWIDVSNPTLPVGEHSAGWVFPDAIFYGIDVSGNSVFLTSSAYLDASNGGLWVLDGHDPGSPPSWTAHASPDNSPPYDDHRGNIGEVEVDGNVAYVFGMDDEYIGTLNERLFLDSYEIINPSVPGALDSRMATHGGSRASYARERMGVIEVIGDTVYSSVRIIPYRPFDGYESSIYSMRDNHIHLFNIQIPDALDAFLGTGGHNIGFFQDWGDMAGDIDMEGNVLYSLAGNHDDCGPPLPSPPDERYGLFSISYDLSNSRGPGLYPPYGIPPIIRNSEELDWDFFWSLPNESPTPHEGPHPLDLLIDGDYGFASAGDIDFYPREGLWFLNVKYPDAMTQAKISFFEFVPRPFICKAKVNGMDIAGDYLYAVGTVSYLSQYEHRFWSIKVYERNHSTGGFAKRAGHLSELPENLAMKASPNPFNSSVSLSIFLPDETELSLKIIDITGREVGTVAEDKYTYGNHTFVWNADCNPSGLYFAVLEAGTQRVTQKLLLVR